MRIKVRVTLPVALAGFLDHLESWRAGYYFEHCVPPSRLRTVGLAIELLWFRFWTTASCAAWGHNWVDTDFGDPEVGPQPCVFCTRCGRQ